MPTLRLDQNSEKILTQYNWEGNIRQLKNVAEQMSVLEKEREVVPEVLKNYIPEINKNLPALIDQEKKDKRQSQRPTKRLKYSNKGGIGTKVAWSSDDEMEGGKKKKRKKRTRRRRKRKKKRTRRKKRKKKRSKKKRRRKKRTSRRR